MGAREVISRTLTMRRRAIAMALCVALVAAGCGGDDGGDDDGTTATGAATLSKEQYIQRGDEICAQGTLKLGQEAQSSFQGRQPTQEQAIEFGRDVAVPNLQDVLDQLRELPAPAGDEQRVNAIYDALQEGIDAMKEDPELFVQPNTGGVLDEAIRLAQAYGFKQCGQS